MYKVPWWDLAAAKADQVGRTGRLFSLRLALIPREVARPKTLPLNSAVIEVDVTEYPLRLGKKQRRKWLSRISSATRCRGERLTRGQVDRWLNTSRPLSLSLFLSHAAVDDYVRAFPFPWRRRCQLRRTMKRTRPLRWPDRPKPGTSTRLEVYNWLIVGTIRKVSPRIRESCLAFESENCAISFSSTRLLKESLTRESCFLIHPSGYEARSRDRERKYWEEKFVCLLGKDSEFWKEGPQDREKVEQNNGQYVAD